MNDQIGARELRVVDVEGVQIGVLTRDAALAYAVERGLDLASDLRDVGHLEGGESLEGPSMTIVLAPNGGNG